MRVLHVLHRMNRGGVETWLMHVLRNTDPAAIRMDFLVNTAEPGHYDAEIRAAGARVLVGASPRNPWSYARTVARLLRTEGPYDVVHSHLHHFSGIVLALAKRAGVPVRIAHSHNDWTPLDRAPTARRKLYLRGTEWLIGRFASRGFAASEAAALALFGARWRDDARWSLLYYGLDFGRFRGLPGRAAAKAALGIEPGVPVIGHVGRFDPQKNHELLVRIARVVVSREPRAVFVLVGDGKLREPIRAEVERLGLSGSFRFLGVREDVPEVLAAFDAFLFPSLHEGLGIVVVEAQAAGVPVVMSDAVPAEAEVVPRLVRRLPLTAAPEAWADALLSATKAPAMAPPEPVTAVEASRFNLTHSLRELAAAYGAGAR